MSLPKIKAKYTARTVACSFGSTQSTGNYQVGVTCEVVDGEHAGAEITWIGFFTEKTQERTIESLQNMGWKGDDLSELAELDAEGCKSLLADHFEIACDVETYEGDTQLKVKWVNRPGAGRFSFKNKVEGSELKAFAQQMRGTIRGMQHGAKNGSKPAAKHPNAPGNDGGDIPF